MLKALGGKYGVVAPTLDKLETIQAQTMALQTMALQTMALQTMALRNIRSYTRRFITYMSAA